MRVPQCPKLRLFINLITRNFATRSCKPSALSRHNSAVVPRFYGLKRQKRFETVRRPAGFSINPLEVASRPRNGSLLTRSPTIARCHEHETRR